jgi:hypothetical protein
LSLEVSLARSSCITPFCTLALRTSTSTLHTRHTKITNHKVLFSRQESGMNSVDSTVIHRTTSY